MKQHIISVCVFAGVFFGAKIFVPWWLALLFAIIALGFID